MPSRLLDLENEALSLQLNDDASGTIMDRATGTAWSLGPVAIQEEGPVDVGHVWIRTGRSLCEQYPGRFQLGLEGSGIRVRVLDRQREPIGSFHAEVQLSGRSVTWRLSDLDESLPSLVFPTPVVSESLVVPMGVGRWIRKPLNGRHVWRYPGQLNMRWFGGLRGNAGWLAELGEGAPDAGALAVELTLCPLWLKCMGRWTPRSVTYHFTDGGYVGLAKTYRRLFLDQVRCPTLRERITANPSVESILGGRALSFYQGWTDRAEVQQDLLREVSPELAEVGEKLQVNLTYEDVRQVLGAAQASGFHRGLLMLRGWIPGGYDDTHPDIWPPDPAFGTMEALADLTQLPDPILPALHDNYQDIYTQSPSWPKGVIRLPNGNPMPGGLWAGGQAYILNPRDGLAYAKRNWNDLRTLRPRAMFPDTVTAVNLYESYEPGNEIDRSGDLAAKLALLQFFKDQGQVLGSEEAADFGVPTVDFWENRHTRVPGESIPIWPLVFHDYGFATSYTIGPSEDRNWRLPAMLWGYYLIFSLNGRRKDQAGVGWADVWRDLALDFEQSFDVDRWHAQVGGKEMTDHRYVGDDPEVEQTTFEDRRITVDFRTGSVITE